MNRFLLPLAFLVALTTGCTTARTGLDSIQELGGSLFAPPNYKDAKYYDALGSLKPGAALDDTAASFVYRYLNVIDSNYEKYIAALTSGKAAINVGYDSTTLFLSGAATAFQPATTKTVLSGLSTFFQGQRQSIDKNFFDDRAMFALTAIMEIRRTEVLGALRRELLDEGTKLGDALITLGEYYRAGTLHSALQASYLNQQPAKAGAKTPAEGETQDKGKADKADKPAAEPQPAPRLPATTSVR